MKKIYIRTEIISGRVREIYKSYERITGRLKKIGRRGRTKEEIEKQNYRNAVKKITRLMNCNFCDGDLHIVLTYPKGKKPTPESAKKCLKKWQRAVRRQYKNKNLQFKWIAVTEYKNYTNIHHHLVINNPADLNVVRLIQEKWKWGVVKITPLYSQGQYRDLAEYFVKETAKTFREQDGGQMQRWSSSRNLKKPVVHVRKIKAKSWDPNPKPLKGFWIDQETVVNGINPFTQKKYQSYSMIEIESEINRKKKKKKTVRDLGKPKSTKERR